MLRYRLAATSFTALKGGNVSSRFGQRGGPRVWWPLSTARRGGATSGVLGSNAGWPSMRNKHVGRWMLTSAGVVSSVVIIGGVTRLTESGLSIVDWRPVTGVRPPLSHNEWEAEFNKYKQFPEFQQRCNMTISEFQFIFFWEWAHRMLARSLGLVYGIPMVYFFSRRYFHGQPLMKASVLGLLALGGAQGCMGWFMVRSGLDKSLLEEKRKATVSSYRLAAHLTLAFIIYSGMVRLAYGLRFPKMSSFAGQAMTQLAARLSFMVMFCTAISGAFVAGLDAGLMYNDEFPWMGGGVVPPGDHLWVVQPWWRNCLENPAAAQTWHRMMAGTTTAAILCLNAVCHRHRATLPPMVKRSMLYINGALVFQVSLGVWTVLSYVEIPVAASHQLGSLVLLTTLLRLCAHLGSRGTVLLP